MIQLFLVLSLLSASNTRYLYEKTSDLILKNDSVEVHISKNTGNITSMILGGKNVLKSDCAIYINGQTCNMSGKMLLTCKEDRYPVSATIQFTIQSSDKIIKYQYTIDKLALRWEVRIVNNTKNDQEVSVDFTLPISKNMEKLFHCGLGTPVNIGNISRKILTYRRDLFLPMIVGYSIKKNYGLSLIAPLEIPKPGLQFSFDNKNCTISYSHLRLTSKKDICAAIYVVPHEGDWRPGLNYLVNKYPEYFRPVVVNTMRGEGWYAAGRPNDSNTHMAAAINQNVRWVEFTDYFPFYGLYMPRRSTWDIITYKGDANFDDWEKELDKSAISYDQINNCVNLWHKYGVQFYLYFQSFEAWHQYAERYFASDIARDKNGNPLPAWKFCNLMDPDPTTNWGIHIINQTNQIVEKYPEIEGIFYDRMDYGNYDFAHDDGLTFIDNKPAYMLGFALEKINDTIFDILHKNKKGVWGNIPTSIEVCKNLDGIMAEVYPRVLYKSQYLGLTRPIIFYPYDREPKQTEHKLKISLLCGAFPSISLGGIECQRLDEKYQPVFELITNRRWVLSSNPIEVPDEYTANIFQTPDSNYVIAIISPDKSQLVPHPFNYNIPIKINVPDASSIKFAYLLSGDYRGVNPIDFKKSGGSLRINLPYHLSSSLILLARNKKYNLVRLSSPILITGRKTDLVFRVEQFDNTRLGTFGIEAPWFKASKLLKSNRIEFNTIIPSNINGETEIKIRYNGKEYMMSYWIVNPLSIVPEEDIFIHQTNQRVSFMIANNLDRNLTVELDSRFTEGSGEVGLPNKVILQPLENKILYSSISARTDGKISIIGMVDKQKYTYQFLIKTALLLGKDDLYLDDFQKGMKNWTIDIGKWLILDSISTGSGSGHFAYIKNNTWKDYAYEVKIRCEGSDDPSVDWQDFYIFFRLQDKDNFYRFGVHGYGSEVELHKCVNAEWQKLGSTLFLPVADKWYTLRIKVKGPQIIGFINGEKVVETNDTTFDKGGIGIGVFYNNMRCDYKDVIIKRL